MRTDALDYDLPPERIATAPAEPRDAARLMRCDRATGRVTHHRVSDLPALAGELGGPPAAGDLLLVNRSRVVPARFRGRRRETGGRVEGLFLAELDASTGDGPAWRVMLETRGTPRPGEHVDLAPADASRGAAAATLELTSDEGRGVWLGRLVATPGRPSDTPGVLAAAGSTPLPPYIRKARRAAGLSEESVADGERYNTVYAEAPGSVAAPTAGLHFTPGLLERLAAMGVARASVTLHVGPGTFAPVRGETIEAHEMHAEWVEAPSETLAAVRRTRDAGGRVLAVGTTSVRAIESVPADHAARCEGWSGATGLFITPESGFRFRFTDALMTNFHLPRSTLLAMVATLPGVGLERLLSWYDLAIAEGYRFYSYGDAMLIV